VDKTLTWFGPFEGTGAYPTINRQLTAALERRGWRVLRNQHNDGKTITPIAIAHIYPPRAINLRHAYNVALTAWEFAGERGLPQSFIPSLQSYDLVCAPARWTSTMIEDNICRPVHTVHWGFDPAEFTPDGDHYPLDTQGLTPILWAGGTDRRHGFDAAIKVIDQLPDCVLIAKQSVNYPPDMIDHPRVQIIRDDLPSMAPLYRACKVFLHSARGVGFALHVLEAIACGMAVASTPLRPIFEIDFDANRVAFSDEQPYTHFDHHINTDCLPKWQEPHIDSLVTAVRTAQHNTRQPSHEWRAKWTWDNSARELETLIDRLWVRV